MPPSVVQLGVKRSYRSGSSTVRNSPKRARYGPAPSSRRSSDGDAMSIASERRRASFADTAMSSGDIVSGGTRVSAGRSHGLARFGRGGIRNSGYLYGSAASRGRRVAYPTVSGLGEYGVLGANGAGQDDPVRAAKIAAAAEYNSDAARAARNAGYAATAVASRAKEANQFGGPQTYDPETFGPDAFNMLIYLVNKADGLNAARESSLKSKTDNYEDDWAEKKARASQKAREEYQRVQDQLAEDHKVGNWFRQQGGALIDKTVGAATDLVGKMPGVGAVLGPATKALYGALDPTAGLKAAGSEYNTRIDTSYHAPVSISGRRKKK